MSRLHIDYQFLFHKTLIPLISCLVSVILLVVSYLYWHQQSDRFSQYVDSKQLIHEDYGALVYQRRLQNRYQQRYIVLHELGFIGLENRLDWVDVLKAASAGLDLPLLTWNLQAQEKVSHPELDGVSSNVSFHRTGLALNFSLVHEEDLLRFFAAVEQQAPGLMSVDSCRLERVQSPDDVLRANINVTAVCNISLFSAVTPQIQEYSEELSL